MSVLDIFNYLRLESIGLWFENLLLNHFGMLFLVISVIALFIVIVLETSPRDIFTNGGWVIDYTEIQSKSLRPEAILATVGRTISLTFVLLVVFGLLVVFTEFIFLLLGALTFLATIYGVLYGLKKVSISIQNKRLENKKEKDER